MSSIVFALVILVALFALIPLLTKRGMMNAARHDEDRYSSSLHLVELDPQTDEPVKQKTSHTTDPGRDPGKKDNTMSQSPSVSTMNGAARSTVQDHIDRVRNERRKAIRRRRLVVLSLLLLGVALILLSLFTPISPWYAAIPAVLLIAVLALGARATARARKWERTIRRAFPRGTGGSADKASSPSRQNHHGSSSRAGSSHRSGNNDRFHADRSLIDSLTQVEDPADKTGTMSRVEIQETLTLAIREQAAAVRGRAQRRMQALQEKQAVTDTTTPVSSREIVSHRQVSQAVPPANPPAIPSSDMAAGWSQTEGGDEPSETLGADIDAILNRRLSYSGEFNSGESNSEEFAENRESSQPVHSAE